MAERGAAPRVPAGRRRALALVRSFTSPLLPDDYLELVNPLWSTRELRGRIERIERETSSAVTVTIKPGDTVQFVNEDSTPHTVTATDKSFDSGNMDQNAKWSHTFKDAGTYAYICTYHTYMKGTVVVKAAQ